LAKTTIEFGDEATAELTRLAGILQTSKADILRNALSLYSYVYAQISQPGKELGIISGGNRIEKVIAVPGIQFVRVPAPGPEPEVQPRERPATQTSRKPAQAYSTAGGSGPTT
jgi:hypothetical protein